MVTPCSDWVRPSHVQAHRANLPGQAGHRLLPLPPAREGRPSLLRRCLALQGIARLDDREAADQLQTFPFPFRAVVAGGCCRGQDQVAGRDFAPAWRSRSSPCGRPSHIVECASPHPPSRRWRPRTAGRAGSPLVHRFVVARAHARRPAVTVAAASTRHPRPRRRTTTADRQGGDDRRRTAARSIAGPSLRELDRVPTLFRMNASGTRAPIASGRLASRCSGRNE